MKTKAGFTILYAVLVSSLILALGMGIVAITLKEVQLSGAGRDSQFAFYAADSGAECAFYWDLKGDYFATTSPDVNIADLKCNEQQLISDPGNRNIVSQDFGTTTFKMYMAKNASGVVDISGPCADVTVVKYIVGPKTWTSIDSRGYNTCDETNPRRLERGYRIEY